MTPGAGHSQRGDALNPLSVMAPTAWLPP